MSLGKQSYIDFKNLNNDEEEAISDLCKAAEEYHSYRSSLYFEKVKLKDRFLCLFFGKRPPLHKTETAVFDSANALWLYCGWEIKGDQKELDEIFDKASKPEQDRSFRLIKRRG